MKNLHWWILGGLIVFLFVFLPIYAFGQSGFRPDDVAVWDSLHKHLDTLEALYSKIDTTAAKIPTATLADSANGGAVRATTSKTADSSLAMHNGGVDSADFGLEVRHFISDVARDSGYEDAGDNLGNHTATQDVILSFNKIKGSPHTGTNIGGVNLDVDSNGVVDLEILSPEPGEDSSVTIKFLGSVYQWVFKKKWLGIDFDMDSCRFVSNGLEHSGIIILNGPTSIHTDNWVGIQAHPSGYAAHWVLRLPSWDGTAGMALIDSTADGQTTWGYPGNVANADYGDVTVTAGAWAIEIPNGANPTTDSDGDIAFDSDDEALEVYDGAVSRLIPTLYSKGATIIDPDGLVVDTVLLMDVDADLYPGGIKVTEFALATYAASTYSVIFLEMTDPSTQTANCDTVATAASKEASSSGAGIYDSDIAAGNWIGVILPATAADQIHLRVNYYVKDFN